MRGPTIGLAALTLGYVLSQFYRAFLAVLSQPLQADIGAGPGDLATASGLLFVAFAAVQLPIGWALDRVGPGITTAALLAVGGGGGALWFSLSQRPGDLYGAMILLGLGCAPMLMASYYILAREYPAAAFSAMAGTLIGLGSVGDIFGTTPLVRVVQAIGWRATMRALAVISLVVAGLILALVRTPARPAGQAAGGSLGELLRVRALWPLLPIIFASYACVVAVRGVWAAPLIETMHGGDDRLVGRATLVMGLSLIVGNLAAGRMQRLFGTPRRAAVRLTAIAAGALGLIAIWPDAPLAVIFAALSVLGLTGGNYAMLMGHGRAFIPPHLIGRGITFLNTFSLAGVGVMQFASRPIYQSVLAGHGPRAAIAAVFAFFLAPVVVGLGVYLLSREAADA